ncbi:MAG: arginine--tRNA ligase [Phycisphaera sp.]|nr:MAG: arginine--tRNA ligase [Phycisphaera sp.]
MTTKTETTQRLDPVEMLGERFVAAIGEAFADELGDRRVDPLITPSKTTQFGDYQSNAAMSLAKQLKMKPRDVAERIVEKLDLGEIAEPLDASSIAGPGFINVRLRPEALASLVTELDRPGLGVEAEKQQTIVVDVCGVNLAKQMHVGHLRATVIGDAMARTLEKRGHKVVRQNHVGDWGLPIAMVTDKLMREVNAGHLSMGSVTLDDLDRLYKVAKEESSPDAKGLKAAERFSLGPKVQAELEAQVAGATENLERAKQTLVKLQSGDPETVAVWQKLYDVTMAACMDTCQRLHTKITDEATAGESSFRDKLAGIVELLIESGLAEEDDGALIVRNEGLDPTLVRKSDGGFLYATTDLAAVRKRVQEIGADRVIYCVDARQALHFKQVFATAKRAGLARKADAAEDSTLEHAPFGMVLGDDGRPFKTRSGENVKLGDVIDEAIERASAITKDKNPDLSDDERARVAHTVAVAALKYADLSSDRVKDYVFDWDRMLAFEGNTGPYLLFAYVRIKSIFRKAGEQGLSSGFESAELLIREPEEKTLALTLLRYPSTVAAVARSLEPHRMCGYLYELAGAFSRFFEKCQVLRAEDESVRLSRLRLCDLTARVLADGLDCLGIETLERM